MYYYIITVLLLLLLLLWVVVFVHISSLTDRHWKNTGFSSSCIFTYWWSRDVCTSIRHYGTPCFYNLFVESTSQFLLHFCSVCVFTVFEKKRDVKGSLASFKFKFLSHVMLHAYLFIYLFLNVFVTSDLAIKEVVPQFWCCHPHENLHCKLKLK